MKRYSEYKDSGVKWIGEIPKHWKIKTLRAFIRLYSEKNHADKQLLSVTREQGVISRNVESKEENHNYIPDDLSGYKLVREGDFAINKMKSWQGSYGVSNYEGIVSPAYYVCKLEIGNKDFFSKAIRSKAYVPFFNQYSKGIRVDQWDLSPIALKSIPFFEPPLSEQTEIVSYLDSKVAKIDRYISTAKKKIAALDELKQVTIADAVTHGINANAKMKDSGIKWIGMVPEHWNSRFLSQIANEQNLSNKGMINNNLLSLSYGRVIRKSIESTNGLLPFSFETYQIINNGNIILRFTDLQNDHKSLRVGLVTENGIITSAYTCIAPKKFVLSNYLYFLLHSADIKKVFYGMGGGLRQNLNYTEFRKLRLMIPPLSEQNSIASYIDHKVAQIEKMKAAELSQIEKLKEYKQRLISDVVTGKVKVTND